MKEATHTRKGHVITEVSTGMAVSFPSINKAKKESQGMQRKTGCIMKRSQRTQSERSKTSRFLGNHGDST